MAKSNNQPGYLELKTALDEVMSELLSEDLDVDSALAQYKKGLELVKRIEEYLKTAENEVKELKVSFNNQI